MKFPYISPLERRPLRKVAALFCTAMLGVMAACGGSSSPAPIPTVGSTAVQVNLGDGPADWMLAFSMNVTSMSLTGSNGSVNVTNTATPMEMLHRLGTMEPMALISAPQGTYTGATMTIAACNVTYLDPTTKALVQKTIQGPFNATIPFGSNVTLGTTPLAFNFDLDLENSVSMDGSGNLQFSPKFQISTGTQTAAGNNGNSARNGGMQQMMGVVNSSSANSFSMTPLQAINAFTFTVNSATQFQGQISNMAMMGTGMGVLVSAILQPDGSLLATRVRANMKAGGIMGGGIITSVTGLPGQPATQLTLVMQNGAGASMMSSYLSQTITVNLTAQTSYEVDDDRIDLTKLPFTPVFNATNIYAGQSVLPTSTSGMMTSGMSGMSSGTITASDVSLQEQGFRGTNDLAITPGASGTFVLSLVPGCAFATLIGASPTDVVKITVYQLTGTNVESSTAIPANSTVRVHGLLFKNAGQWTLIASTIAAS